MSSNSEQKTDSRLRAIYEEYQQHQTKIGELPKADYERIAAKLRRQARALGGSVTEVTGRGGSSNVRSNKSEKATTTEPYRRRRSNATPDGTADQEDRSTPGSAGQLPGTRVKRARKPRDIAEPMDASSIATIVRLFQIDGVEIDGDVIRLVYRSKQALVETNGYGHAVSPTVVTTAEGMYRRFAEKFGCVPQWFSLFDSETPGSVPMFVFGPCPSPGDDIVPKGQPEDTDDDDIGADESIATEDTDDEDGDGW